MKPPSVRSVSPTKMPVVCDPHEIMASTTSPLLSLPDDLLGRCMHLLPLGSLVPSIAALRLVCRSLAEALAAESAIYTALLPCFVSVVLVQPSSPSRRSARLAELSPGETFRREWRGLVQRLEARHHTIACAGQDSKDLTLSMLKARVAHFGERLIDRPSPVYNATLLMEVCRARGAREQTLIALAEHLVLKLGADPSARPHAHAVTPLIIAAARGLPKLAAFLLACGADPRPRGEGRFRLCGQRATVSGILCARGFVRRLYLAEEQSGVLRDERESLLLTHRVLEAHGSQPRTSAIPRASANAAVSAASRFIAACDYPDRLRLDEAEACSVLCTVSRTEDGMHAPEAARLERVADDQSCH